MNYALRKSLGHSPCHLHHQRDRIPEQRHPQGDQQAQIVLDERLSQQGAVHSGHGRIQKMNHADPQLETGVESVYP